MKWAMSDTNFISSSFKVIFFYFSLYSAKPSHSQLLESYSIDRSFHFKTDCRCFDHWLPGESALAHPFPRLTTPITKAFVLEFPKNFQRGPPESPVHASCPPNDVTLGVICRGRSWWNKNEFSVGIDINILLCF